MSDERKGFKFTASERERIHDWLHTYCYQDMLTGTELVESLEELLTNRFDTPEGQLALAADSD